LSLYKARRHKKSNQRGIFLGLFPIKYEPTNLELKLLSAWINFRSKVFALPFGDQGLLVKRALYEEVGGFKDYPFLEDVDLVLRLRKKGRPKFFPVILTVSSRKLKPHIPFYPTFHSLRNFAILLAFLLGCSPNLLAKFYK
jgi:hypothetical protein